VLDKKGSLFMVYLRASVKGKYSPGPNEFDDFILSNFLSFLKTNAIKF
jgi:hypothetical protein